MSNRIPTLDGWRGIAILMVLVTHFQMFYLHYRFFGWAWLELGQHGVNVFFVLSGYLITSKLLAEERIDLKRFYVRRFFRIMPAAWTFLLVLALMTWMTPIKAIDASDLWGCLFFYRNYIPSPGASSPTVHFWSLSMEEQFYLMWPFVLALFGRRFGLMFAGMGAISVAAFRMAFWNYYATTPFYLFHSEVRMDGLFVGCVLAFALSNNNVRAWITKWSALLFWLSVPLVAYDVYRFQYPTPLHESILVAVMIASTSLNPRLIISKFLETEHIKMTGVLSYSLYVWQQLFMRPFFGPWALLLIGMSAILSWKFIEQPGIVLGRRLGEKLERPLKRPMKVAA